LMTTGMRENEEIVAELVGGKSNYCKRGQ